MTATELATALAKRAEQTAKHLLPKGTRKGREWVAGSIGGEAGSSLSVCVDGEKAGYWSDFAAGGSGDFIGLWQAAKGVDLATACQQAEEFLGLPSTATPDVWKRLQSKMRKGTVADLQALAALRKIPNTAGLELATHAGHLFFGDVWDEGTEYASWIITDGSRINAQARRMDGATWHEGQKAKTIKGCKAAWPIGIHGINGKDIALVEGGPDLLAAWHLIWAQGKRDTIQPAAMIGAGMSIHAEALPLFLSKRVHLFPHKDAAGEKAAHKWNLQLTGSTIHQVDMPVKDLNDWVASVEELPPVFESKSKIMAHLDAHRVRFETPPPEPVTRLFLAGKPIATPGNLVTVIAKSKTGKTTSLGAAVAAIIAAHYDAHGVDTFKFTAPHTSEAVILFDTEQSPYDAWECHKRLMERAGKPGEPAWLHHYALVGDSASELRKALPAALENGRALHQGVFCLILDGVADFVASVNDEAECNEFIAFLRKLAVEYNCPIICVIHSNEGVKTGDDGRGHLGKQLTRKAESNLLLKKVGEVTTITSEKQRKAPITEADQVAFQWSDEHGRHVSCDNPDVKKSKAGRKPLYDSDDMLICVPRADESPKNVNQIHRDVEQLPCNIDIRTFKDYVAKWVQTGEVVRIPDKAFGWVFRRN